MATSGWPCLLHNKPQLQYVVSQFIHRGPGAQHGDAQGGAQLAQEKARRHVGLALLRIAYDDFYRVRK